MLTMPTAFSDYHQRLGAEGHTIVELTDGVSTWLFSDTEMELTDGHVYATLNSYSGIQSKVDLIKKSWGVNDVYVSLINKPYRIDSSDGAVSFSDEMGDIYSQPINIYFLSGPSVSALSDCLNVFVGIVSQAPSYDSNEIKIRGTDKGIFIDRTIPQSVMSSVYPNTPDEYANNYIPLAYGKFTPPLGIVRGNGLAKAYPTDTIDEAVAVISDHILNANTESYMKHSQLPGMSKLLDASQSVDDSGFGTLTLNQVGSSNIWQVSTDIRPPTNFTGDYDLTINPASVENFSQAVNLKPDTYATAKDYDDTGSAVDDIHKCHIFLSLANYDQLGLLENKIGRVWPRMSIDAPGPGETRYHFLDVIVAEESGVAVSMKKAYIYYSYSGGDSRVELGDFDAITTTPATHHFEIDVLDSPPNLQEGVVFHFRDGLDNSPDIETYPIGILLYFEITGGGDGVDNNRDLIRVHDVIYQMFHDIKEIQPLWAECEGREYGSWISSRSSNYSSGDVIEDPAGIVESILRDELGLANADIDLPTFIDSENTSVKSRINVIKRESAFKTIRKLAEQSTFAFTYSGAGKAKLIPLNDSSPSTDRIIHISHIADKGDGSPDVTVGKTDVYCNDADIRSRWQGEYREYRDNETVSDATSISNFGTINKPFSWPNIADTSLTEVVGELIGADGLWSRQHNIIIVNTVGYTNADLDLGDWIEIDSNLDHHLKVDGVSWSGKQFLIMAISKNDMGTQIKALER